MNMNRFSPNWSATKSDDLRRLWMEGLGYSEIARRMGITLHAVANKASRLGLPAHKVPRVGESTWPVADTDRLRELWAEGKSASVIGGELGRSKNAVIGKVHRLRLPTRVGGKACVRKKPGPKAYNPGAFRKSRAKPPELHAARQPRPPRPQEVPPPEARMVSLLELQPGDCKWPIGDPVQTGFGFCGAKRFASFCYCQHHVALAYIPAKKRGDAPKAPALHSGVNGSWRQAVTA